MTKVFVNPNRRKP